MRKIFKIIMITAIALLLIPQLSQAGNYSATTLHWGFKKSQNHQPPDAGQKYNELLKKHNAFYLGDKSKKEIFLTFDNGYENGYTAKVLDVLKKKKVPAAFFVTGYYLKDQPELVKRMVNEGHIVGNHSWHHPDMTQVNDVRFKKELDMIKDEYKKITGLENMTYMRPPRGTFSDRSLALANQMGYQHVFWSLAYVDWNTDQQRGWKYAYDNIMAQIHPGAILLLHSVSKDNADAMERVIEDLQEQGYVFKSLDELGAQHTIPNPILLIQEN
ncbi:delta-lactam-biosynthetic de-N-acetylase [Sutcliffiella horikoshii]|uniref:delta-lactam-biosynthetic de-N-acetylase n=1 Tax=Sutcliffiella horikoshii TaxID=79883 RepID=UPI00203E9A78|nr:delta-lactam-biosynthetic de-N-acetylase [Sutcliffiella horikoshii]MCM3618670.1 delta-lactam-biosynthetic de-N-acetylase [Sutcliffiella horikoshii]